MKVALELHSQIWITFLEIFYMLICGLDDTSNITNVEIAFYIDCSKI